LHRLGAGTLILLGLGAWGMVLPQLMTGRLRLRRLGTWRFLLLRRLGARTLILRGLGAWRMLLR
jgi:hypothetical protein